MRKIRIDEACTVCVPAFRSGDLLVETLRSLQEQTFQNFQALISVDGDDKETLQRCQPFLKDLRFKVFLQKQRLGWVQNTNWGLSQAKTRLIAILPHDDLYHPYFLEELISHMLRHPECALAYSDTEAFSDDPSFRRFFFVQHSVKGSRFRRMETYLKRNFEAVGFRGVIAKWALDSAGPMQNGLFDDFAVDTLWLGKIAKEGELHRVPYVLCKKRYHPQNTHTKWFKETKAHQRGAWKHHCEELLAAFVQGIDSQGQKQQLLRAANGREQQGYSRFSLSES